MKKYMHDYEKYQEAMEYVTRSLTTALACLDVKDKKAMKALSVLNELVEKYKASEIHENILWTINEREKGE